MFSENFATEGSADGFINLEKLPPGPLPPGALMANIAALDGNGLYSSSGHTYPGNGLVETNPPVTPPLPMGDTLDDRLAGLGQLTDLVNAINDEIGLNGAPTS